MAVTPSEEKTLSDINASDIVDTVPSALITLDKNLNITSANRAFYQTFRTSAAETVGCHIYELGSRQWDIPALRSLLESVIPHRTTVEGFEVEHDFPSIGRRTMLVNARKIFRQGGVILLAIEDVSEERSATQDSDRNRLLTQSIVDTIRDPLVVLEKDMTIVTASAAFLKMFRITEAELQGRPLSQLGQHQWDVPMLRRLMEKVLPDKKTIENFEIEDDFPGLGRRVFNLNARKIARPGNHSERILLVFEDITERKQRERDIEMLTNEISHRIKNNLQLIVGLIAFEAQSEGGPSVHGYKAMQERIGAIAQLYDLISHSKDGRSITVDAYLTKLADALSATLIGKDSGIVIAVDAEPLEIDPDRAIPFGLLINELATNAVKHAFPGGRGHLRLSVRTVGGQIELIVADDGIGIANRSVAKVPEKRGSDYVAIFVRQLGGTLDMAQPDEAGTRVRIRLPYLVAPPATPEAAAA